MEAFVLTGITLAGFGAGFNLVSVVMKPDRIDRVTHLVAGFVHTGLIVWGLTVLGVL